MNNLAKAGCALLVWVAACYAIADNDPITIVPVSDNIIMLRGEGGNIGVLTGSDGTLMIDDKFAALTDDILAAIRIVGGDTPKILINTHWHGDHTGGNENFGKAGSLIIAHDNVRVRRSADQFIAALNSTIPATGKVGLPPITFLQESRIYWNGDRLRLVHVANAHTDGDIFVHFEKANVIHAGDIFFNGFYPFIDVASGGSLNGMLAAVGRLLELADEQTLIIPGHGSLARRQDLVQYQDMLALVAERVSALIGQGKTRGEIIVAKPTQDLDKEWGGGFLKPDIWVGMVVDGYKH